MVLKISASRKVTCPPAYKKTLQSTGHVVYEEFYPRLSKDILDEIDQVIGAELGLTQVQQEFFVNFEIKYRMGSTDDAE